MMDTYFSYRDGELHAEGVPLSTVAREFQTPCYVYAQASIQARYRAYQAALAGRPALICYAVKANSNQAILRLLAKEGAGADVVSGGELRRALQAGFAAQRIVFSGVGKSADEIRLALEAGILQINVESASEFRLIQDLARTMGRVAPVAFRINPDVDAQTHAKISTGRAENKFGMDAAEAAGLYRMAMDDEHLAPQGLAVHIGSQISSLAPYREAWLFLKKWADRLRAQGLPVARLDAGGGLAISYRETETPGIPEYAALLADVLAEETVIIEPGRSLVGHAGILLTRVLVLKKSRRKNFAIVDASMSDLLRPALYDAYHDIVPVQRKAGADQRPYDIVGPVCESSDCFASDRTLPVLAEGDLLAIRDVGAYGAVMASEYNTRPLTEEILISGSRAFPIRRRPPLDSIIARDRLPDWLT
ncbi:MAG TPA: diaminopimelate decarboxylase [Dongiaceae bacterium]|jgi:diaminopimelate decarboxylase|nr:diaminopimelate decarboxylase [Dongiaceae bacterium]